MTVTARHPTVDGTFQRQTDRLTDVGSHVAATAEGRLSDKMTCEQRDFVKTSRAACETYLTPLVDIQNDKKLINSMHTLHCKDPVPGLTETTRSQVVPKRLGSVIVCDNCCHRRLQRKTRGATRVVFASVESLNQSFNTSRTISIPHSGFLSSLTS